MAIQGISKTDLKYLHWNYGNGRGALGLQHVPSGLTVVRESSGRPIIQIMEELAGELRRKLEGAGILKDDEQG